MKVTCLSEQPSKSLQTTNAGASGGKQEPSWTVGGTTVEDSVEVPQQLKLELLHHPAVPPLGIYPDRTMIWKDTNTSNPMLCKKTISLENYILPGFFHINKKQANGFYIFNEIYSYLVKSSKCQPKSFS